MDTELQLLNDTTHLHDATDDKITISEINVVKNYAGPHSNHSLVSLTPVKHQV